MTDAKKIFDDLEAETVELNRLLATLSEEQWNAPTPAAGWDVVDTVVHLADTDEIAYDCVTGGTRDLMHEVKVAGSADAFTARQLVKAIAMEPAEVYTWWQRASSGLIEALRAADPSKRIPWGPNTLTPASFATARLMEIWAHGLDCHAGVGSLPVDSDRLQHVAFIGWRALPFQLQRHGIECGAVRIEITAPDGNQTWEFGPPDAPTVVRGAASDWCRVAVQRDRDDERSRLEVTGPDAEAVLKHAQAYL